MCGPKSHGCWHEYPERGWIQFLIMRILYERPMHGYQLLEEIEERSCGCHRLEPGSIYTLLRRMEERGLLESKWEKAEGGVDRRVYRLTDKGVEALKTGLTSIVKRKRLFEDLINFYYEKFEKSVKECEKDV
ncbi:MAG: PadR family transcriptional regulator [Thaumarchaeota archaeon]|nr:PadR family transcriptional regulator [Candidatus Terraquivivens yellowstonensis]